MDVQPGTPADLAASVGTLLGRSLDTEENVGALARLVVPYLGDWSIVSVLDEDGGLVDVGHWHRDPEQRATVAEYVQVRLAAFPVESFAAVAVRDGEKRLIADAARTISDAMRPEARARELLRRLNPGYLFLLPMMARGRVVGLLSLYSDTSWEGERRAAAEDVAARAALAIDNSLAYARERSARRAAEAASERLQLLARVSEVLTSIDDPDEAVGRLARLVVPILGDWSFITVRDEDGTLRDIGRAHRDPAHDADLLAYSEVHLEAMSDAAAVTVGLQTGRRVVVPHLDDARLAVFLPDPEVAELTRRLDPYGVAVLPLTARNQTYGVLVSATTSARGSHTPDEIELLHEIARRAGPVLDAARAARRARTFAETMQRSLLVVSPPAPGLHVATRYRPAHVDREVGGDWYDVYPLPDGSTAVTIGDVMGHDLAAIASMAQLRTMMRTNAWARHVSPAATLAATDDASFGLGPGTFATVLTAVVAPVAADGSTAVRWSNAGHLPPAVLRPDGRAELLSARRPDLPLGVRRTVERHDLDDVLPAGSVLVLYTDGLVERRDRDIDQGVDELLAVLRGRDAGDLDTLLDSLLVAVAGEDSHDDDVALVALRVGPPPR